MPYAFFDFPLVYRLGVTPGFVHMTFGSGDYDNDNFTVGDALLVVDIGLTGTVTATRDARL